jgi:hypothetical protein
MTSERTFMCVKHLTLMVDQRHDAIVRSQESLLAKLGTISVR